MRVVIAVTRTLLRLRSRQEEFGGKMLFCPLFSRDIGFADPDHGHDLRD